VAQFQWLRHSKKKPAEKLVWVTVQVRESFKPAWKKRAEIASTEAGMKIGLGVTAETLMLEDPVMRDLMTKHTPPQSSADTS